MFAVKSLALPEGALSQSPLVGQYTGSVDTEFVSKSEPVPPSEAGSFPAP